MQLLIVVLLWLVPSGTAAGRPGEGPDTLLGPGVACTVGAAGAPLALDDPALEACLMHNPRGWLEAVDAQGVAHGWTCDPDDFSQPLHVHFYVNGPAGGGGTYIGQTLANLTREPAVGEACGGNPHHGYNFLIPTWLWDGHWRTLYAYGINVGPGEHTLLLGSGMWFRPPGGGNNPIGWLDFVDVHGVAHGWTCDADDFSQPLYVHLYVNGPAGEGGTYIGQTLANLTREPAVGEACGGNPHHGYSFRIPDWLRDGNWRTLYAYGINIGGGHNALLNGSGRWFNAAQVLAFDGFEWNEWGIEESDEAGTSSTVRCKWQRFTTHYSVAGVRVVRYEGSFRVCYEPNVRIVRVEYVRGDVAWTAHWVGWYSFGNDPGYPTFVNYGSYVVFHYRAAVKLCLPYPPLCLGPRHPWETVTFFPNNTMRRAGGVI